MVAFLLAMIAAGFRQIELGLAMSALWITLMIVSYLYLTWDKSQQKKYDKQYRDDLDQYSFLKVRFEEEKRLFDIWLKHQKSISIKESVKMQKIYLSEQLSQLGLPTHRSNGHKKGRIELMFANYLNYHLPGMIAIDYCFETSEQNLPYIPDIIYFNKETGLAIIIEIDEPYTGRQPIHYVEKDYKSIDESRNYFFLRKNWIIIRFAEEQVALNPAGCLSEIRQVITEFQDIYPDPPMKFHIHKIKKWTAQEAEEMSNSNYRETYLGRISSEFVNQNETFATIPLWSKQTVVSVDPENPIFNQTIKYPCKYSETKLSGNGLNEIPF